VSILQEKDDHHFQDMSKSTNWWQQIE
jgi:hypothetical protein